MHKILSSSDLDRCWNFRISLILIWNAVLQKAISLSGKQIIPRHDLSALLYKSELRIYTYTFVFNADSGVSFSGDIQDPPGQGPLLPTVGDPASAGGLD